MAMSQRSPPMASGLDGGLAAPASGGASSTGGSSFAWGGSDVSRSVESAGPERAAARRAAMNPGGDGPAAWPSGRLGPRDGRSAGTADDGEGLGTDRACIADVGQAIARRGAGASG